MQEKISKHVEDFLNFLRNAQSEYTWSMEKEKEQDELTQDFLHLLELENPSYHERAKIAGYLSEARQERRQYKDNVEELKSIVEFVQGNKKFLNELEQVLGEVRKQEKYHMNRSYRPRVLDEETIERVKGK